MIRLKIHKKTSNNVKRNNLSNIMGVNISCLINSAIKDDIGNRSRNCAIQEFRVVIKRTLVSYNTYLST